MCVCVHSHVPLHNFVHNIGILLERVVDMRGTIADVLNILINSDVEIAAAAFQLFVRATGIPYRL